MADLWVPFAAAFVAAAAALLVRQVLLSWANRATTRRASARGSESVAGRAIIPVMDDAVGIARMPGVEITPARPVTGTRPFTPIIIGAPIVPPQTLPAAIITASRAARGTPAIEVAEPSTLVTAAGVPLAAPTPEGDESDALVQAAGMPSVETPAGSLAVVPTGAADPLGTERDGAAQDGESDQTLRLRIAVGPGRPSTTVGGDSRVWSHWIQEVKAVEVAAAVVATPVRVEAGADEDCPHCSSARHRGARFCGRCGRDLASAVTAS